MRKDLFARPLLHNFKESDYTIENRDKINDEKLDALGGYSQCLGDIVNRLNNIYSDGQGGLTNEPIMLSEMIGMLQITNDELSGIVKKWKEAIKPS